MPAKSAAQRKLFGMARGMQEGHTKMSHSPAAARIAKKVKPATVRDFARMKTKKKKKMSLQDAEKMYARSQ